MPIIKEEEKKTVVRNYQSQNLINLNILDLLDRKLKFLQHYYISKYL